MVDDEELSPTSPGEDSDTLLADVEPEPAPGIDGTPVRWYDANRAEPYTRTTPFQERHDPAVEFLYKPVTLTTLGVLLVLLAYLAMTQDVLAEGADKRRMGVYAAIAAFLAFAMIQFRDGPFIRPHPAVWRVVLGVNLLYELVLVFFLFQELETARGYMVLLDPTLGVPLPEKGYADDCRLTPTVLWEALDIFCIAHALGWYGKALILRDYWFCWILSIMFELAEYSLQHQLPNFNECWWDHWVLDVLLCNWLGTYLGMKTCQYLEVKPYAWRGTLVPTSSSSSSVIPDPKKPRRTARLRSKAARALRRLGPHDFTRFTWGTASSFSHYLSVVLLLAVFLAAELSPFYLKSLLWLEPAHPIVVLRLAGVFLCALPAVRELFQYVNDPRRAVRMGQHVWLLLATVITEILLIFKWSSSSEGGGWMSMYPEPFPRAVKWGWGVGCVGLVVYPIVKFGMPELRRWAGRRDRKVR
ncbi:phosphatidyl serine synthase-domain-containing protein [Roridomyces roridus]|uniref:Phosphatidyl serine synthase-domain-containing protein n=1 Tax=Roridomyces roridus TaxID=1738132 RepID=A0AAD7CA53_9AGAR|nr:phosphatidyl serine synthase-domain-containing protein [Roridomyces roridus]